MTKELNRLNFDVLGKSRYSATERTVALSGTSTKTWKDESIEKLGPMEIFFDTKFMTMITYCKLVFIVMGILSAAYAGYRSTEIQGLSKMEDIVKEEHYAF